LYGWSNLKVQSNIIEKGIAIGDTLP
jgi:hypothetical protein